jgi:hypothetical protein
MSNNLKTGKLTTGNPDSAGGAGEGEEASRIVISGLDEVQAQTGVANISPTDQAVERLQRQRDRGEPEDEDG